MQRPEIDAAMESRKYAGVKGLAELPYFEMTERDLLRLVYDDIGPGIDGHVHFATNALAGPKPDLLASHPTTRYYLDRDNTISLENYMGQNNTEQDVINMSASLWASLTPEGSAWTKTHTIPNLIAEMDLLNIEKSVVLPLAFGFPYGDDMTEWYIDAINRSDYKDRFIICGGIKPTLPNAVERVKQLKLMGVKGIKAHPNFALFTPDDKLAWAFYEECSQLGLPLLMHCGLVGKETPENANTIGYTGRHAEIKYFSEPVAAFPSLRFVFCHAGGLQNDMAIEIAKKHKHVWLDMQGQGVSNLRKTIREVGPERLLFGSDWPFFPVASLLARLLLATEGDATVRRMILRENALRLYGLI